MSTHPVTPAVLAENQALACQLARRAPQLAERSAQVWQQWCDSQRTRSHIGRPALHVITTPHCFADLAGMPGLNQVLGLAGLDCTLTLCAPNAAAARLLYLQARREGLEQLISIEAGTEPRAVAARLDPATPICIMPSGVLLTAPFAGALAGLLAGTGPAWRDDTGLLLAQAGEARTIGRTNLAAAALAIRLAPLLIGDLPAHLAPRPEALLADFDAAAVEAGLNDPGEVLQQSGAQPEPAPPPPGGLQLERLAAGSDLLIEADTPAGPLTFFRRPASLLPDGGQLHITPPLAAIGTHRHVMRVMSCHEGQCEPAFTVEWQVPPSRLEPWMVTAYLNRGGGGNRMIRAFADGIGCELAYAEDAVLPRPGVPVVWGVLRGSDVVIESARQQGQYFFYIDHAYFNRGHGVTYRITRNGYEAGAVRQCPRDRFDATRIAVEPWRRGGREIIVCPPTAYFMQAHHCNDWLDNTLATLKRITDRPIVIRDKPKPGEASVPLPVALQTAHALVTHSSNVAIESVLLGTPVFVSPSSAAAPMGLTNLEMIESPVYPDRDDWLAHMAYSQFSYAEIQDGRAWRMLLEFEERPFA